MNRSTTPAVVNPGNGATATILDTSAWNRPSPNTARFCANVYVTAQPVTVTYEVKMAQPTGAGADGTWVTLQTDIVAAGNSFSGWYAVVGAVQRIRVANGATAPTLYEVTASVIYGDIGAVA